MKFEDHCAESILLFGKPYEEIHRWLDDFAGTPEFKMRHRKKRHHEDGLRQVRELFGEEAVKVAMRHIISDLQEEGWTESDPFPKNEEHYIKMGLF